MSATLPKNLACGVVRLVIEACAADRVRCSKAGDSLYRPGRLYFSPWTYYEFVNELRDRGVFPWSRSGMLEQFEGCKVVVLGAAYRAPECDVLIDHRGASWPL